MKKLLVQRYGDFWLIPRNLLDSCLGCCDKVKDLRQSRGRGFASVVKGKQKGALMEAPK